MRRQPRQPHSRGGLRAFIRERRIELDDSRPSHVSQFTRMTQLLGSRRLAFRTLRDFLHRAWFSTAVRATRKIFLLVTVKDADADAALTRRPARGS